MKISILIEAMFGLSWPLWKQMASQLAAMDFEKQKCLIRA